MTSRFTRVAALTVGLASAGLMLASQATAATTWTVTAGSAAAGTSVPISGATTGTSPQIQFTDTTSSQTLTCASGTAPGSTKTGTGLSGTTIGKIYGPKTKWKTCTGPFGLTFVVTGINTWSLNAKSFAAPTTTGNISGIKATVVDAGTCSFTVTGTVGVTYSNTTHNLTVPGTTAGLTISGVSGCLGLINNNDKAKFHAVYHLTANNSAFNPIKITSP